MRRPNGRARPGSRRCCTTLTSLRPKGRIDGCGGRRRPGVDGVTVESYGQDLEGNLRDLADRVHGGRYRPLPARRTYIPKADGGQRPLGILSLEDKIVQGAVAEVLSAIYEADFLDCSFGFRPRRSAHQALRVVREAITTEPVNWVLDADIRRYLDTASYCPLVYEV